MIDHTGNLSFLRFGITVADTVVVYCVFKVTDFHIYILWLFLYTCIKSFLPMWTFLKLHFRVRWSPFVTLQTAPCFVICVLTQARLRPEDEDLVL